MIQKTGSLSDMVKIEMSERQKNAMARIDAEGVETIIYLTAREDKARGCPKDEEYYEAGCTALKQYYATSIFDRHNMHAISADLDPFWHSHIIDTVAYKELCDDIDGFMHHDPLNKADRMKVDAVAKIYDYTNEVLAKIFGSENLDERFFPKSVDESVLVCLHDLELKFADVFPVNPEIEKLRESYGHKQRQDDIRSALKGVFA